MSIAGLPTHRNVELLLFAGIPPRDSFSPTNEKCVPALAFMGQVKRTLPVLTGMEC